MSNGKNARVSQSSSCSKNINNKNLMEVGISAEKALNNYLANLGKKIMRADGNRAYLPLHIWLSPIWQPTNFKHKAYGRIFVVRQT